MSERIVYISRGESILNSNTTKVVCTGYQQHISLWAFERRFSNTAFELNSTLKDVYSHTFRVSRVCDIKDLNECRSRILLKYGPYSAEDLIKEPLAQKPINLYDYYKSIGYDYKSGKINRMTIKQYFKSKCERRIYDRDSKSNS